MTDRNETPRRTDRGAPEDDGGHGSGVTSRPSIAHPANIPLPLLSRDLYEWACERAADTAIATGRAAVAVGIVGGGLQVCTDGCCLDAPGGIIAVPDTLVAELAANGRELTTTTTLHRDDGRTVVLFRTVGS